MPNPQNRQELQKAITGDRYRILKLLVEGEQLASGEICNRAEIPQGSRHYQLSLLKSWGLIKQVDTKNVDEQKTGSPASVYTLTAEGEAFVQELDKQ